ncbi:MAG: ArsC/Spx/MgsR family protein [bacterium]
MAPRRAQFLSYGDDEACTGTREFIEQTGVLLDCRDIAKHPLSVHELRKMIGTHNVAHFMNKSSEAYRKAGFDVKVPDLATAVEAMAKDHTLIRRPIIRSARLVTIGCDQRRITEMLQLNADREEITEPERRNHDKPRRSSHGRNMRHPARAAK